jgi:hypothetical protein
MAEMGSYCKAYLVKDLRAYPGWREDLAALRPSTVERDGEEVEVERTALAADDVLFVQDDYVVTDGTFKDEHVVFGDVTDDWKQFCRASLGFEVPAD